MAANEHPELTELLEQNRRDRERLQAERDALILRARQEGMKVTHIANAVGLSTMQVHRIVGPAT